MEDEDDDISDIIKDCTIDLRKRMSPDGKWTELVVVRAYSRLTLKVVCGQEARTI